MAYSAAAVFGLTGLAGNPEPAAAGAGAGAGAGAAAGAGAGAGAGGWPTPKTQAGTEPSSPFARRISHGSPLPSMTVTISSARTDTAPS